LRQAFGNETFDSVEQRLSGGGGAHCKKILADSGRIRPAAEQKAGFYRME
jgi:hypothetical protein